MNYTDNVIDLIKKHKNLQSFFPEEHQDHTLQIHTAQLSYLVDQAKRVEQIEALIEEKESNGSAENDPTLQQVKQMLRGHGEWW
ncbi:hypothetical protein ETZ92_019255 [Bacillus velezensis]|uniref:hypothetical protein n=1 Tax=Bacillus velezensis TaxID=492670 RepID=UPI000B4D2183|nr:hypothetical protein [Bacillus velezensis]OWP58540.1 hypothetical protein CEA92_14535 [Bacillus velezensis]QEQ06298.1 hypothetical protein ETZ92_019255 [Bacillus velezensis]